MANFKDKLQVFFLGLLLGLVLGGGFFVFKLDEYVKELSIYKSITRSGDKSTESAQDQKAEPDKNTAKPKIPQQVSESNHSKEKKDTTGNESAQQMADHSSSDSLKTIDTVRMITNSDDIVVRKDQLLNSKTLELVNVSALASNTAGQKDSAAAKMAGVREDHNGTHQFCSVEFWTSPLNYRGYKMNRNKVILYGLTDTESVRLFKLDDEVYLHAASQVYKLDYTSDFRPYERVTNETVLSRLK